MVVTLTGAQRPAALADVMRVLDTAGAASLTDFGQLVLRGRFTATAVLAPAAAAPAAAADAFRGIIVRAHAAGINVEFDAAARAAAATAAAATRVDEYVVTLFSPGRIPARLVADAAREIADAGGNIGKIDRLSDAGDQYMCLELSVSLPHAGGAAPRLREALFLLSRATSHSDIALQPVRAARMAKRIVVFDLSWTLVRCDAVDVLLAAAGVPPDEAGRAAYRAGELNGTDWLRGRVARLEGADADAVNAAALAGVEYTAGARQLCKALRRLGCRVAVVSSGSRKIAEKAREDLGLDYVFGNNFEVDSARRFTGVVSAPIIDADRKADLVQMLAMQEGVDAEQVVAVGDGPVSSKMLSVAGMSVAFDQPDSVDGLQTGRISSKSLASVFYLLGVTGRDFRELLET